MDNDGDSTSIFSKLIGREISHISSADLYSRCWVDFTSNAIGTEALHFVDLGILAVNISNEINIFGTPATRIRSPMDGSHWSTPDHFFGEATAVGMSATRSELDHSLKTDFQSWRINQDCGRQNISMNQSPL